MSYNPPSGAHQPGPGQTAVAAPPMAGGGGGGPGGKGSRKNRHDDEEQGKLFVGGLSWDTTQDTLLRYFSRFGEVIDCVVMKNAENGRSRGFGFVTFSDPSNIDEVLASGPHNLDGRTIDPKACNPRSMQKPKKTNLQHYPKVFLGGLPSSITETDLRSFFSRYGEVVEVVIMYDQEKKKSRGFGFLSFGDETACATAVAEHFVNIQNKQVEIKRAEPRTNQQMNGGAGDAKDIGIPTQQQHQQLAPPPQAQMMSHPWNGHPPQQNPLGGPPPPVAPHAMPPQVQQQHVAPPPHVPGPYAQQPSWQPPGGPPPTHAVPPAHPPPAPAAAYPTPYASANPVPPPVSAAPTQLHWGSAVPPPHATAAPPSAQMQPAPTAVHAPPPVASAQWTPQGFSSPPPTAAPAPQFAPAGAQASTVYPAPPSTPQQQGAHPATFYGSPQQPQVMDPYAAAAAAAAGMTGVPHAIPGGTPPVVPKVEFGQYAPPPSSSSSTSVPSPPVVSTPAYLPAYFPQPPHGAAPTAAPIAVHPTSKPYDYGAAAAAGMPPPVATAAAAGYPPVSHETSLGPQRGAAYGTQPSPYHPYRRT